jgi:protoheme IX farnesyltransferase
MAIGAQGYSDALVAEWGGADIGDYLALLKPRVMSLVIFTALVGMVAAPQALHPALAVISLIAISFGAGAAGALNMWYEADIDGVMRRTRQRPLPAGRIGKAEAGTFGLLLAFFSVAVLGLAANWLAAGLLAFTIFFYVVVYTMWLKRRTAQNIVIGGAAGALPPVVAWSAMTGSMSVEPLLYFLLVFLWTPPHFWALALFSRDDYARAGIPMLPNVAGEEAARRQVFLYSLLLAAAGLLPWLLGYAGTLYGLTALVFGCEFVRRAVLLLRERDTNRNRAAKNLFGFSILYLFILFAARLTELVAVGWIGG